MIVYVIVFMVLLIANLYALIATEKSSGYNKSTNKFVFYPTDASTFDRLYRLKTTRTTTTTTNPLLRKCKVSLQDCGNPLSRCVHMNREFKFVDDTSTTNVDVKTYPPNETIDEGYCINAIVSNADAKRDVSKFVSPPECNPNTAERILLAGDNPSMDGHRIMCVCKYPDIITQKVPLVSDCNVPVACEGGRLVGPHWWNPSVRVNVLEDLSCADCPAGTHADRDPITRRPVCRKRTFVERDTDDGLYPKDFPLLSLESRAIEPAFAAKFSQPEKRQVPNVCAFDFFTLKPFKNDECQLASTDDGSVFFCKSNDIGVATLQADDDYLRGNGGKWANGCFRYTDNPSSTVRYAIAEFYNNVHGHGPIIGYPIKATSLSSQLVKLLDVKSVE